MGLYTAPILYVGSHLSLKQNEVDATTGEKLNKGEAMNRTDAMLFPIFGSVALFSLYLAYKFLGTVWVNMLLTLYLTGVGLLALGETIFAVARPLCPPRLLDESWMVIRPRGPFLCVRKWLSGPPENGGMPPEQTQQQEQQQQEQQQQEQQQQEQKQQAPKAVVDWSWRFSPLWIISHLVAVAICILWLLTKHWALHNILAIAFCIQAIALVSVRSFGVASILLCGLFVYDVVWVFGTEVMVSVAKRFPKFYFCVVLSFYELGLLTTGIVMLYAQHPQPALLYLVPYCLFSLFGAAALNGKIKEVLAYKEEDEGGSNTSCSSASEQTEKKEN
ncbi:signal peptide peptidase domain-containing protein, putative [Eimeria mitis]|uniref:Signal peptide peptidase domain-containing protein, putative n=1 Tax=Eimeria mitis TaxID=44415 RepID=U6KI61_9EIME|nr:signal peptide peptidase domain-containing protein, putative [Eimeria mitis]CDJ35927.1 signal peptide peptidase domain-containing protein, putative [Eimeria mitis]